MTGIRTRRARSRRIIAVASVGALLLTGATVTSLAAWLDEEWVTAGVGGIVGVASSEFEIEQLVDGVDEEWENHESAGQASVVSFDEAASRLSPGASAVGWVSLRAAADSVGGKVVIQPAAAVLSGVLAPALRYSAWLHDTATSCTDSTYATGAIRQLVDDQPLNVGSGATTFELDAGATGLPGADDTVCFRITLPVGTPDSVQGASASVGWYFESTSD